MHAADGNAGMSGLQDLDQGRSISFHLIVEMANHSSLSGFSNDERGCIASNHSPLNIRLCDDPFIGKMTYFEAGKLAVRITISGLFMICHIAISR